MADRRSWVVFAVVFPFHIAGIIAQEQVYPFVEITDKLGISTIIRPDSLHRFHPALSLPGKAIPFDFDRDGDLDLLMLPGPFPSDTLSLGWNRLYRNDDTSWVDVTRSMGLHLLPPAGNAAVGDVDNDGFLDLYLCTIGPDRLLSNLGGKKWVDVTESANIDNHTWSSSAVFLDANGDGYLDIYVGNYLTPDRLDSVNCYDPETREAVPCNPEMFDPAPNRFYRNIGSGVFVDATEVFGLSDSSSRSLDVQLLDFNQDGYLDILVLSYQSPNLLYLGSRIGPFTEVGFLAGCGYTPDGDDPDWDQVTILDADVNGTPDLLFTGGSIPLQLLLNTGKGSFIPGNVQAGLYHPRFSYGFGSATVADLDFNGRPDLLFSNPHWSLSDTLSLAEQAVYSRRIFHSNRKHRFTPVTSPHPAARRVRVMSASSDTVSVHGEKEHPLNEDVPGMEEGLVPDTTAADSLLEIADSLGSEPVESPVSESALEITAEVPDSLEMPVQADTGSTEEPITAKGVDLTGDGIDELLCYYLDSSVGIWQRQDVQPPRYLRFTIVDKRTGSGALGARIRISMRNFNQVTTVTDPNPVTFYLPEPSDSVQVAVEWPRGGVSHYRLPTDPQEHTLIRENISQ